jgi:CRP-like cAMP-binding protein
MQMSPFEAFPIKKFDTDEVLLYTGDLPSHMFYLKSGKVKQITDSNDGKELIIHIFEKDAIFPLEWGLNDDAATHTFVAMSPLTTTTVPKKEFLEIINKEPKLLLSITKRLVSGLSGLSRRIEILNFESAQSRIQLTLGYLEKHFGDKMNFTHEELAALTGLSRERVSIEMKKLKQRGNIDYSRGKITLRK